MRSMDDGATRLLLSPAGQELLASLPPYDEKETVRLSTRLREAGNAPDLVAAVLTQSRLRQRGHAKFGSAADSMLFTPDALEQATRSAVASRHAERLRSIGMTHVVDAGCGIGADAVGFAQAGLEVTGIEADPTTAALARHNLAPFDASVETGLVEDIAPAVQPSLPSTTAWWFDPARRVPGVADINGRTKRTFALGALSPSWDLIRDLAGQAPAAGAKLSPSLAHADVPAGCEAEFVSYAGDVVEATVWWNAAARTSGRSATIIKPSGGVADAEADSVLHVTEEDAAGADTSLATRAGLGPYFYEADKALTRSGLVGALLKAVNGRELTGGYGYVTADALVDVGLLGRGYRVGDVVPLHTKTLRAYLKERGVGRVTIKKRDVDLDPDHLRRSLKLKGSQSLTLVLTHLDGNRVALVVDRV